MGSVRITASIVGVAAMLAGSASATAVRPLAAGARIVAGCSGLSTIRVTRALASAFNRGDAKTIDRLVAQSPAFRLFAAPGPNARIGAAARRRSTLLSYVRVRHRQRERLTLLDVSASGRPAGTFQLVIVRQAKDYPRRVVRGQGRAVCAGSKAKIVAWTLGSRRLGG
jgi:hypothetical protein